MSDENNTSNNNDVELLTLAEIDKMVLGNDFVITKTAKLRADKTKTGEKDDDGKDIFVHKQREFKVKINFAGKTINDLLDYASSPMVITWANGHRPLGDNWIQTNADKNEVFNVDVKNIGREKKPKIDPVESTVQDIISGKITMEEFQAKIELAKKNQGK